MEEHFGDVARKARIKARVSIRQLADALGWSPVYVSDIERGSRNPPRDKVRQWAELIGADPDAFERLSLAARDTIELPVGSNRDLALALTRKWGRLTQEQEERLLGLLREGEGSL